MDVDKLQRINALASELRKHNIAFSSDDAYREAKQVYEEGSSGQVVVHEAPRQAPQSDELSSRKVELILEMNNKKYDAELQLFRNAINTLAQELETLRSEVRKAAIEAPPRQKEKQAELKTEVKEDHPRQGKFQPSDVDIQKMFYFGNKR